MRKIQFVFLFLTIIVFSYGQDIVFEKEIHLKGAQRDVLPVYNYENNLFALFLLDNENITGLLIDKQFKLTNAKTCLRPADPFCKKLLGVSIQNTNYHLFFSNNNKTSFYIKSLDLENGNAENTVDPIKLKKEKYLESFSYNNKFYILSIVKRTSKLKMYVFEGKYITHTEELDFSSQPFRENSFETELYNVLRTKEGFKIHKLEMDDFNEIDVTSKPNKLYTYNNHLYITIDNEPQKTILLDIDLINFSYESKEFLQTSKNNCFDNPKSNSYLYKNHLYQITGCKNGLTLNIKNILQDSIIKTYSVSASKDINFKNTPLMQSGSSFSKDKEKEVEKMNEFWRKTGNSNLGVSAYEYPDFLELTIGSHRLVADGKQLIAAGVLGIIAGGMAASTTSSGRTIYYYNYNPYMDSYYASGMSRAVYFKTLLNPKSLEHIQGTPKENIYKKIKKFADELSLKDINYNTETVFKIENNFLFGYYIRKEKKYVVHFFEN